MATTLTLVAQPVVWIYFILLGIIIIITTLKILKYEYAKRKSKEIETIFVSKIAEISSLACLISCPLFGFSLMVLHRLNIFCFFCEHTTFIFWYFQICFMGLYQISRLHYCFSQSNNIHSNTGYPKWLIYIMYIIGTLAIINSVICPWFLIGVPLKCGCNEQYLCTATYNLPLFHPLYAQWVGFTAYTVIFWDFLTLILYIIMVFKLKNQFTTSESNPVYDRIMAILHRILILTIFYEIIGLTTVFTHIYYITNPTQFTLILDGTINGLLCIALSFAMLFMQQHNTVEYKKFLKVLYTLKCHNCLCFCFRSRIKNEVELYLKEMEGVINHSQNTKPDRTEETVIDTAVESVKMEHSAMPEVSTVSQIQ